MTKIEENQKKLLARLALCKTNEDIYKALIEIGETTPSLDDKDKIEENRVHGCQSQLYITHHGSKDALFFQIDSDALISKGLATLLTKIFNGSSAEEIVKSAPTLFKEINLLGIISPTRITGIDALEKRMKQIAVNYLI